MQPTQSEIRSPGTRSKKQGAQQRSTQDNMVTAFPVSKALLAVIIIIIVSNSNGNGNIIIIAISNSSNSGNSGSSNTTQQSTPSQRLPFGVYIETANR
ncbi:hypothetical protein AWZ03_000102 [Drosophila navojoa]|uniref:Uncharacterized protein n=1 Tax=Drosophila navojoa TaxID=7232 RepID=A0A484BWT0_DRONA|nr:hypothetical protein AWZ03_000102 [Drosophila navojoa]